MADIKQIQVGTVTYDIKDAATASALSTHTSNKSNPHSVTKSQVGLGSVVNTGDSATPVSGGTTKFTTGGAYNLSKRIENLESRGRFLSTWDASTGKPSDLPSDIATTAYVYKTGDYYVVKTAGTKNPSVPSGNTIPAGTTLDTWTYFVTGSDLAINDSIYFTGSAWQILHTPVTQATWGTIGGTLSNQTDLNTALAGKVANGTTSSSAGAHTHSVSGTAASAGAHTHTVTANGSISVGTGTANYTPGGTVASHTHSIAAASTTTVNTGYTHTPASLGGTTTFNTDAIKSVSLNSATQTSTGYIQYVESATSPSLGGTTTFLTSIKTAGSASLTGTTSFLTGIKTAGSASLTGTTTFNTNAVKATVNGTTLELTAASTGTVGISHSDPTFNSGTVGISHSDPTFNTGTVTLSGGAHTTKYLYPSTTAASKGTVTISGGSIASVGTATVVTGIPTATGATQPGFSGTPVELKFTGSSATTSSTGAHTHTLSDASAASAGAHTHTVG